MPYIPKSKREPHINYNKKVFDGLSANKQIDDIIAMSQLLNVLEQGLIEQSDLISTTQASVDYLYNNATYTVELDETFTRSFKAPQNIKITAIESSEVQEVSLEVEGTPYVLGDSINKWDEITVLGEAESTVNLTVQAV